MTRELDLNHADSACTALRERLGIDYPPTCPICGLGPCQWQAQKVPTFSERDIQRVAQAYSAVIGEDPFAIVKGSGEGRPTMYQWEKHLETAHVGLAMELALKMRADAL